MAESIRIGGSQVGLSGVRSASRRHGWQSARHVSRMATARPLDDEFALAARRPQYGGKIDRGFGLGSGDDYGDDNRDSDSDNGPSSSSNGNSPNGGNNASSGGNSNPPGGGDNGSPSGSGNGSPPGGGNNGKPPGPGGPPKKGGPPPGCVAPCVSSSDPKLVYSDGWTLVTTKHASPTNVLHRTDKANSTVSFDFNGTAIVVFGLVPKNSAQSPPPIANYSVDGQEPMSPPVPNSQQQLLQPLFTSSGLLQNETHSLLITVTDVQSNPYTLSHLLVDPNPGSLMSFRKQLANAKFGHGNSEHKTLVIVTAMLGSVVFLLLAGMGLFFFLKRRRGRKAASQAWRRNFQQGSSSDPTLTSSASILRSYSMRESSFYPYTARETATTINAPSVASPPPVPRLLAPPSSPSQTTVSRVPPPPPTPPSPRRPHLQFVPPAESVSGRKQWI